MGFIDILIAASMPVLKVLLVTALGSYLALDHVNILGTDARKHLNIVALYILNPALLAANLARTITYESMVKLWFMPLNVLITFVIGSILGLLVVYITRAPKHLRGLIVGCSAAGNLGNLPLIIVPAVCRERGSPFGAPDTCSAYGIAYSSLSLALGNIYTWTYVYNIVRVSSRGTSNSSIAVSNSIKEPCRKSSESDMRSYSEPLLVSKESIGEDVADQHVLTCSMFEGNEEATPTLAAAYSISRAVKLPVMCSSGLSAVTAPMAITAGAAGVGVGSAVNRLNDVVAMIAEVRSIADSLNTSFQSQISDSHEVGSHRQ